jgi:hypothetical protein
MGPLKSCDWLLINISLYTGCPPMSISPYMNYQLQLLIRNACLINVISIDCNESLESLHPSEKNLIQGDLFNIIQDVLDCAKNCTPIRELVSSWHLLNVTEEIEIGRRQIRWVGWVTYCVVPFCSRNSKTIFAGWDVHYRHEQSTFDRFPRPNLHAILPIE